MVILMEMVPETPVIALENELLIISWNMGNNSQLRYHHVHGEDK